MKLTVPLKVKKNASQFFHLNLNNYRNTHYRVLHKVKKDYQNLIRPHIKEEFAKRDNKQFDKAIHMWYTIYLGSKRRLDIANVYSIVDKFLCDALVEEGVIKDDDYKHLVKGGWEFGGIDPDNPRADITIEEVE